jgi:threonine dehydrogenase-like Zn-dependent dehydrogenase
MKAVVLYAKWKPRKEFKPGLRDIRRRRTQQGNLVWRDPKVELVEKPLPKLRPMEILIELHACGVCGSDVLMAWPDEQGYTRYPFIMANEVTLGHEVAGRVVKIGNGVKEYHRKRGKRTFAPGTPVTVQCVVYCGRCRMCKRGYFDDCLFNEEFGFSLDGGMASYMKADIRYVHTLNMLEEKYGKKLFLAGALIEPLAGVYKALVEVGGGIEPGEDVVIIGAGPIGLSAVALSKVLQASKIIVFEPVRERRRIARLMGATHVFDPFKIDFREKVLDLTLGGGAAVYFEAAGVAPKIYPKIEELFQAGMPKSKFILMGHGPGKMEVSHEALIAGYHLIIGSHGHCGVWPKVVSLVASKAIDPTKMITRKISLDQVPRWLEILRTCKRDVKVMVTRFG